MNQYQKEELARKLVKWYRKEGRKFPWREEGLKPYEIMIAEMMLQKTRAEMVAKAYADFLKKYPDIHSLNSASLEDIAKILKPLGLYNRRAKWMKTISKILVEEYEGEVPSKLANLLALPGIGIYIANAVLCFAYSEPVAVVDVNVARVIARVEGIELKKDLRRNRKLHELVGQIVPSRHFKEFNWALIDLGAVICTSTNPKHQICPVTYLCAFAKGIDEHSKGQFVKNA